MILPRFHRDVGHRDHSDEVAILVDDRNTPYLFVAHLANHINDAIVRMSSVNIDRHDVFGADLRAILAFGNRANDDVAVGD